MVMAPPKIPDDDNRDCESYMKLARRLTLSNLSTLAFRSTEYAAYLAVMLMAADQLYSLLSNRATRLTVGQQLAVVGWVLVYLIFVLNKQRSAIDEKIMSDTKERLGVDELIPSSQDIDVPRLLRESKNVRILSLAGTKLARLGDGEILAALQDRGRRVTLLLADPRSPAIITRYEDDEPPTYETGLDGLDRRLRQLHSLRSEIPNRTKARFEIRIYRCYPTCSILQFDEEIYSITYGYKLRGSDCPKIRACDIRGKYAEFLKKQFEHVYNDSITLEAWIQGART